jgi:hypothetical protein
LRGLFLPLIAAARLVILVTPEGSMDNSKRVYEIQTCVDKASGKTEK